MSNTFMEWNKYKTISLQKLFEILQSFLFYTRGAQPFLG